MKRFLATVALLSAALANSGDPGPMLEWPYVGADQAGTNSGTSRNQGHVG